MSRQEWCSLLQMYAGCLQAVPSYLGFCGLSEKTVEKGEGKWERGILPSSVRLLYASFLNDQRKAVLKKKKHLEKQKF